jgi:hypothetical protein
MIISKHHSLEGKLKLIIRSSPSVPLLEVSTIFKQKRTPEKETYRTINHFCLNYLADNMQLTTLIFAALASFSLAAPLGGAPNDLQAVITSLGDITTKITTFDTTLKTLTNATDLKAALTKLHDQGEAITESIKASAKAVRDNGALTEKEADWLAIVSFSTATVSSNAIKSLQGEKAIFAKANALPAILSQLNAQKAATLELIKETKAKVPEGLKDAYDVSAQLATVALDVGIAAFA